MFRACFRNLTLGAFRPGRTITVEAADSPPDERATLMHERAHEYLTTRSTLGIAALICGNRKANHDVTVLPDKNGMRAQLQLPYLRHFQSTTAWIQEGTATACEAVHWAEITKQSKSDLLLHKPDSYALAAREFLRLITPLTDTVSSVNSHLRAYIEASIICATGLAMINPPVRPTFYQSAVEGKVEGYRFALQEVVRRRRDLMRLPEQDLIFILAPIIEAFVESVHSRLNNLDQTLEELLPGTANASLRESTLAASSNDPTLRNALSVTVADIPTFRDHVVGAVLRFVGLENGQIEANVVQEFGISVSPRTKRLLWTERGKRSEVRRPIKAPREQGELWQLEAALIHDDEHLMIPEVAGPFIGGDAIFFLHVFKPDTSLVTTLFSGVSPPDYPFIKRQCIHALYRLCRVEGYSDARCCGLIVPFGIETTPLFGAVSKLPLIRTPHFGIPEDEVKAETLIGIHEGNGLVRQALVDDQLVWQIIRANVPDILPLTNILERCFAWALANGGNAHVIWKHNNEE